MSLNGKGDAVKWIRLLEQKFNGSGGLVSKEDLDTILDDYTSLADFPCAVFAEDLIAAYPDAKVILSVRDSPDAWYRSFNDTVWKYQRRKIFPSSLSERFWGTLMKGTDLGRLMSLIFYNTSLRRFPTQGRQWYLDHNEMVRRLVPGDRLLELNAKEGWGPLCEFLGVEQPAGAYPTTNDTQRFQKGVDRLWAKWQMRKMRDWLQWLSVLMVGLTIILSFLDIKDRGLFNIGVVQSRISIMTQ